MGNILNMLAALRRHYDKLLAVIIMIILVGSLLYLALEVSRMHKQKDDFERHLRGLKPRFPTAEALNQKVFEASLGSIESPTVLGYDGWKVRVLVPEKRMWCEDCLRPIPFDATNCPFVGCGKAVTPGRTEIEGYDKDGDRIPSKKEIAFGLDPDDPTDAEKDMDGDGFSNIEEYEAQPQTDLKDPKSHPPITAKLRVKQIVPDPFKLRFKAYSMMPDGTNTFQVNLRGDVKTFFVRLGDTVEGFKVEKFEEKFEERRIPGMKQARRVDVSVLTLKRGDKLIPLIKGERVQIDEYTAVLFFTLENKDLVVKVNDVIDLKGDKFKIIAIDFKQATVLIEALSNGQQAEIKRTLESPKPAAKVDPALTNKVESIEKKSEPKKDDVWGD